MRGGTATRPRAADEAGALLELMDALAAAYQEMLVVAREKNRVLMGGDPDNLNALVISEESLVLRAGAAERELLRLMVKIGETAGLHSGATLSELTARLEPLPGTLAQAADRLKRVVSELQELNGRNTLLLQQALAYVNFSIKLLERVAGPGVYGTRGDLQGSGVRRRVDRRV